jgi:hypothetical protein
MPETHVSVVRELLPLLASVTAHADRNKMTAKNLAVVFGPTFLREGEVSAPQPSAALARVMYGSMHVRSHMPIAWAYFHHLGIHALCC